MNPRTSVLRCLALFVVPVFLFACSGPGPVENGTVDDPHPLATALPVQARAFLIGVSGFIPRNYQDPSAQDWQDLFDRIPEYGELFGVHAGWNEGARDDDGVPEVVTLAFNVTAGTGTNPYVALGVEPGHLTQEEADTYFADHGADFEAVAMEIARRYRPVIMLLGVEINRFYQKSPAGFAHFIDAYARTYDAIKAVSPETRVGSNFILEFMMGAGRLSGQPNQEHWHILNDFGERLDLATFTLFPFLDYADPGELPADYLDVILEHTDRPVMITETGWPSRPIHDIRGDEAAQVEFLQWLLAAVQNLSMEGLIWVYPHDHELGLEGGLFDHLSTRAYDGSPKEVYEYWQALRSLPGR